MNRSLHVLSVAMLTSMLGFAGPSLATSDAAEAAIERAEARYEAAKEACEPLRGNEQDVCEEKAKAEYEKAKADIEAKDKGTAKAQRGAEADKAKADYDLAMEKCESLKGQQNDACEAEAKAAYERARANIRR